MEGQALFADLIIPLAVPGRYTYRIPKPLEKLVQPGQRAIVQFGKTKLYTGIIAFLHNKAPQAYQAKYIEALLDDSAVVTEQQLQFWDWISFYYCCTPGEVMNAALPAGLKLQSNSVVALHPSFNPEESAEPLNERESLLISHLLQHQQVKLTDLATLLDVRAPQSLISRLVKKNALIVYEDLSEKYKPKLETFFRLAKGTGEPELQDLLNKLEKKAAKQAEALLYFLHCERTGLATDGWVPRKELVKKADAAALKALVNKNILEEQQFETGRLLFHSGRGRIKSLSPAQQSAYEHIQQFFREGKTALLHGVTGSGKTEVYIQLISDALQENKDVLMLVPEIALTTHLITRLQAAFGELVGVYHSKFSDNERVEIYNNVLRRDQPEKRYRIILGARSALFLPFTQLGLIIIDEEHDGSFKQQDPAPRYQARDAAIYLGRLHQAHVLLGSATPSVESYNNAREGRYGLAKLETQYVQGGGTLLEICDTTYFGNSNQMKASLTPPLFEALQTALRNKEQAILFLNRRGFAPYTECKQCGFVPNCIQCDVSLIFHKQQHKLVCHYCGYQIKPPSVCPACGSHELHYKGMGTEKIEEDIELLFPEHRIARMDLDSTRSKHAYRQLIDEFQSGHIDILIGTQMVTKGLDFANVSVVGVLNADSLFNFPDFRSFERAFQLITQVRGRAGRSNKKGKVFVQTTQISHPVLDLISKGDFETFFEVTMKERKERSFPPYTRLMNVKVLGREVNEVSYLANELFKLLSENPQCELLGPEFPVISRIRNEYHKHILIKYPRTASATQIREHLKTAVEKLHEKHREWRFRIIIDVDPS